MQFPYSCGLPTRAEHERTVLFAEAREKFLRVEMLLDGGADWIVAILDRHLCDGLANLPTQQVQGDRVTQAAIPGSSAVGVRIGPPNALDAAKPTSSSSTRITFGASSGGRKGSIGGNFVSGSWRQRWSIQRGVHPGLEGSIAESCLVSSRSSPLDFLCSISAQRG